MSVLVTGGTGYIGSHICVALLKNGYELIVLDNLYNSGPEILERIRKVARVEGAPGFDGSGEEPAIPFYAADIRDAEALDRVFQAHSIDAVIHFAGLKAVEEAVALPEKYFDNNVRGTEALLSVMEKNGVKAMIFSSTAAVYGDPEKAPIPEDAKLNPANPYGETKLQIERMLLKKAGKDPRWKIGILRYFNAAGAHESGFLCENPRGVFNNLMPRLVKVAEGRLPYLDVFGNDYPTKDGTGVRDYIHVMDLAEGHLAALKRLRPGASIYNLGTGRGYSVLEIVDAFERVHNTRIPYRILPRRDGDIAVSFADSSKARRELDWKARRSLEDICRTMLPGEGRCS